MATTVVKSSVLHGPRDLRLVERDLPAPSAGEVQVAIRSVGLCGSDLHYFNHMRNGDIAVREPLTLGHEATGTVVAVGEGVRDLAEGDKVALEVGLPCGECEFCINNRYNICPKIKFRSSAKAFPHAQGTLQEKVNHPAQWCHRLPDNVSLELGALVEPLSVAMHAWDRVRVPDQATVLVLGAGSVGLLTAAVCRAANVRSIVIADIQQSRLDFAVNSGYADASFTVPMIRPETTDGRLAHAKSLASDLKATAVNGKPIGEFSVVFECTGVESCLQTSLHATKAGGSVVLIGMGSPVVTLPLGVAALREVDIIGVFRYAHTYPKAIKLLAKKPGPVPDLNGLITHRIKGLEKVPEAFGMAGRDKDDENNLVIKVVVDCQHLA